jgi:ABC-type nickel/cobalt efflux system permease component RcnA
VVGKDLGVVALGFYSAVTKRMRSRVALTQVVEGLSSIYQALHSVPKVTHTHTHTHPHTHTERERERERDRDREETLERLGLEFTSASF